MPFPNEHACRVRDPGDFQDDSFRRIERESDGKALFLIVGRLKGEDTTTLQSFRYPKDSWSAEAARAHCSDNNGKQFEPASEGEEEESMNSMEIRQLEEQLFEAEIQSLEAYEKGSAPAPVLYKANGIALKTADDGVTIFIASEETPDRRGDIIMTDGWELGNFQKNPVYMFIHDYTRPPIGTVPKVWIENRQLLNTVKWDDGDPVAREIRGKYERGIMKAESVGFRPLEFEEIRDKNSNFQGMRFIRQELVEISAVPVPMHPMALQKAMGNHRYWSLPAEKKESVLNNQNCEICHEGPGAISWDSAHPEGTLVAYEGSPWDEEKEFVKASVKDLSVMAAWRNGDGSDKRHFKYLHHRQDTKAVVKAAVLAAYIEILHDTKGGLVPLEYQAIVKEHLTRHLVKEFNMRLNIDPKPMDEARSMPLDRILVELKGIRF